MKRRYGMTHKRPKKALIVGISGQDGAYLANFLLTKGYEVYGTSRDAQTSLFQNLLYLGIHDKVQTDSMAPNDFRSVLQTIVKVNPDELYNLSGQSSVGLSFQQPVETMESISISTLNLLEAIRFIERPIKFYNASSSECFGDTGGTAADEMTPFRPRSPYAVAKAAAYWEVANYREAYGLFACSGILFNHESTLRPERFVTSKIIAAACRIAGGSCETLPLGNMTTTRDWGWAPEYVEAMWLMMQQEHPDDYVIATGQTHTLEEFTAHAFSCLGLDWRKHVVTDASLFRPTDIAFNKGNPAKALKHLGWRAHHAMHTIVEMIVAAKRKDFLGN
jgi:GDPmannose 4,6-dehydratase